MNKSIITSIITATAAHLVFATPTITGVTAQQRYPWNGKVDITYTASGGIAAMAKQDALITSLKVTAMDMDANQTYTASSLSGDIGFTDGTHSIVWDMNADGLTFKSTNVVFNVSCETTPATYCVIDLSEGENASSYPVTYLAEQPSGGFNEEAYKTTKLVLRRIEAGTFKMGGSVDVTLTKPFFIGLFEVTKKQYLLVTGENRSHFSGDKRPVDSISYNEIRGSTNGSKWPSASTVDSSSFMGKIRTRTGLDFDLPTEAQWEYACRAGTTTTFNYGDSTNGNYMWYDSNSSSQTHDVGTRLPNGWGLFDMHGNVQELCLDWYADSLSGGTNPIGPSSGTYRVVRGGSWKSYAPPNPNQCSSSFRGSIDSPSGSYASFHHHTGFRLARTLWE